MIQLPIKYVALCLLSGLMIAAPLAMTFNSGNNEPITSRNHATSKEVFLQSDDFKSFVLPFIKKHCLECHEGDEAEGDLDLSKFDKIKKVKDDLETWESIIEAIDDEYMPPSERPQPNKDDVDKLKDWFQEIAGDDAPAQALSHIRRLNRIEYENTIRDLFRMDRDVFSNPKRILLVDDYFKPNLDKMPRHILALSHFNYLQKQPPILPGVSEVPSDPPVEHGFSNDQSGLSFSPLQLERYLELAYSIVNDRNLSQLSGLWASLISPGELPEDPKELKKLARQRLAPFVERAFRRSVTAEEVERYARLFDQAFQETGNYEAAIKESIVGVMVSPSFLFRQDFSDSSIVDGQVDSQHMASRLSYFLWGSIPDATLLAAAREQRLGTEQELLLQVRRMMQDKRIKSLSSDFGMQWLQVAKVASVRPDRDLFGDYYKKKEIPPAISMMIEQLLLFETIMIEDRSILEFVHTDVAYLNRQLLDWYQLDAKALLGYLPPKDNFEDFFRISWPNKHRGGVITSGATLLGTSATTRTSPVYRGAWIMDVIFNRPPPAPPADVPALEDDNHSGNKLVNIREKLKRHREDPNCAVCHDRIDPYGFALENFDAVGQFRHKYLDGDRVDPSGEIFDEEYVGAARFKAVLLRNEDEFIRGFVEHMLKYALGRKLEWSDEDCVDQIVDAVKKRDLKFSAVVEEIVLSDLFRSKQSTSDVDP